ncbi:hypothetical protein C0995_011433 [Termitomyces sp. Mi166|nr:hypothetical protein C0995_011433 [Termitomyces sp. Mi166\
MSEPPSTVSLDVVNALSTSVSSLTETINKISLKLNSIASAVSPAVLVPSTVPTTEFIPLILTAVVNNE